MEQLSGLDTAFVHQDSARTPMHITAVLIYDLGEEHQKTLSAEKLRHLVSSRLLPLPLFSRRLQRVTLDMDTPYWVQAAKPQWSRHISEATLADGASWQDFQINLEELHARRMDLKRPLWELHLLNNLEDIDGLPAHCQALLLKVHHCAIDGISLARTIDALHRETEQVINDSNPTSKPPSQWDIWTRVNLNTLGRQVKLMTTVGNLMPGVLRARKTRQQFSDLPPIYTSRSKFNDQVSGRRSCGAILIPAEDMKTIKRAVRRVTFNDIAVSIIAEALRNYLGAKNSLPRDTLSSGIPISLRNKSDGNVGGNKIATMIVGLGTHIDDPIERVRLVHRYAVAGKKQTDALGSGTVMDISDSLTPAMLAEGIRGMAMASRLTDARVPFHTMISNVPGPQQPMYLEGAHLAACLGLGPIRDNMGLFHIVSSTDSRFSLTFNACRKLLPDADLYQNCLERAFTALKVAVRESAEGQ